MKMKKWLAIVMVLVLGMVVITGCSTDSPGSTDDGSSTDNEAGEENSSSQSDEGQAGSGDKIGILIVTSASQWCNDIVDAVTEEVAAAGMEVIVSDSQVSVDNELSGMENLISSGCKAIVVNAMNPAGLSDLCKQAQDKGIFIIGWSELLENYDALVVEDPESEAEIIAGAIAEYVGEDGGEGMEMAEIWLADSANPDTTAGVFKEALEKEFDQTLVSGKGMNIVNSQYSADTNKAMDLAEAILAANPDVRVIFCQSDEMGVAVAQVLEGKGIGKDEIMVCGLDGCDEALNTIAGGNSTLSNTVYVNTKLVGQKVGQSISKYLEDGTAEDVVAEYVLINRDNAAEYAPQ